MNTNCPKANRLLARAVFQVIEIKCPRCGTLNNLRAASPQPERQRASNTTDHDASERQLNHNPGRTLVPPHRQRHDLPRRCNADTAAPGPAGGRPHY
ncbi:Com family DNA-binding transcriptional regulator [Acidovorax sp. 1608163]|uniref:Com family DNA-binding transcriptional regulator n=1 Tax=Acidovorax sp. 1608163 TaxID=2478662 RepID=UPI000EF6A75F|nr:Com family DNA-binding transcriptional regulator [Acidovorax sp. 1608163]